MQLLHAALSALPAPSLLQGDLEKQLQPLLLARRSSEAAALEAAVLEGAPLPSTASTPTHTLAPDIVVAGAAAAAAHPPLAAADGEGGVPRYWQGVSDTALPRDDAEAAALLERVPSLHQPTACWRLLREWLGGDIRAADRVVLPGQGAMPDCMRSLRASGLEEAVKAASQTKPLFGVCVGEQMLFDWSEEGDTPCLSLLPGKVVRFNLEGRLQEDVWA